MTLEPPRVLRRFGIEAICRKKSANNRLLKPCRHRNTNNSIFSISTDVRGRSSNRLRRGAVGAGKCAAQTACMAALDSFVV